MPVSYLNPWTLEREKLVDISSVSIRSMFNGQNFDVEWTQNNTILILDAVESSTLTLNAPIEDYNGMQFDSSKLGMEYDLSGGQNGENLNGDFIGDRKRRSAEPSQNAYFNPYLQRVIETDQMKNMLAWNEIEPIKRRNKRSIFSTNDHLLANLPVNRTVYFDCQNAEHELCLQGKFTVTNLQANNLPVLITLNFTIDLKNVVKVLTEMKDVFVMRTSVNLMKTGDEDTYVFILFM